MSFSLFEAVKAQAMRSVLKPDYDYVLRHIFRWYSETFSTPLEDVDDIPLEVVLTHYYESTYEKMDEQARSEIIAEILKTEEDRKQERYADDVRVMEDKEFAESVKLMTQFAPKPKPLVIAGEDEEPLPPLPTAPEPIPLPTVDVRKNEMGLPEFSLRFDEPAGEDNLIPDDVEQLSTMRQPEEEE